MSFRRYRIDLAFKEPIEPALNGLLTAMSHAIHKAKPFAVIINEGQFNEEITTLASWHICHHDTPVIPCEPEQEI